MVLGLGLPPGDPEPAPVPSPTPTASRAPTPHLRGALQLHLELRQLQRGLGQGLPKALVLTAQLGVQLRAQEGQGVRLAGGDAAGLRGAGWVAKARVRLEGRRVRRWVRQSPWAGGGGADIQNRLVGLW